MNIRPLLAILTIIPLSACATEIVPTKEMPAQVTYFPQQKDVDFRASMEAVIAGRLVNYNGCFAVSNANGISTILWHPNAKLNENKRSVLDTKTDQVVTLNDDFGVFGSMIDSEPLRNTLINSGTMPEQCITKTIVQIGKGFFNAL